MIESKCFGSKMIHLISLLDWKQTVLMLVAASANLFFLWALLKTDEKFPKNMLYFPMRLCCLSIGF